MTNEFKMCDKTGLKAKDTEKHFKKVKHKGNARTIAANIFKLQERNRKSAGRKTSVLENEPSTSKLLESDSLMEGDIPKMIQSGPERNEQEETMDDAFTNVFIDTEHNGFLFCCACCIFFKNVGSHQFSYKHYIHRKRCKTVFEDRGEKVYCKICDFEIEWKDTKYHLQWHQISPWYNSKKPKTEKLFRNFISKFGTGFYYCFLCETFIDYWDTIISHLMERDHRQRKKEFGPTELINTKYAIAVTHGIVPGRDMMIECKMCNVSGLQLKYLNEHSKKKEHKKNREQFTADIVRKHLEKEYHTDSEFNTPDTGQSTPKLLEAEVLAKENNPKNIKMPPSHNMICNFSLQGSSEQSILEGNESSKESKNVCKTKTEKSEASITTDESDSSEFEEPTSEIRKVKLLKKDNKLKNIKESESRNMFFNFNFQISLNSTSERMECSESGSVIKNFPPIAKIPVKPTYEFLSFNRITGSKVDKNLFCCVCNKSLNAKLNKHLRIYEHKILLERSRSAFEDRGINVFCKSCSSEIEQKEIVQHAKMHEIPPWSTLTKPRNETIYCNHTICVKKGYYYCFLCDTFLDYWDTARSHFMEADHQKRKEKFGPSEFIKTNYELAITNGIVPGRDMMNECKMCNITGLQVEHIEAHVKNAQHKISQSNFIAEKIREHEKRQNYADSESNAVDSEDPTSQLLEADVLPKESNPDNTKVPRSYNMRFNFTVDGNSEKENPKRNKRSKESENVCKTKTHKSEANIITKPDKWPNYADCESDSSEFEVSTSEILKDQLLKKDKKITDGPETGNVIQTFPLIAGNQIELSDEILRFNKITGSIADENLFCDLCSKDVTAKLERHLRNFGHKIRLEKSNSVFEDRGTNLFCKICNSEVKRKAFIHHGKMHELPPWSEVTKPRNETFYHNLTACFRKGHCYCFLCEKFLDYWDRAYSHFLEIGHQKRKEQFGPTELVETKYELAVLHGIVPGKDMLNECKMCNKTGFQANVIKKHVKKTLHKRFKSKFIINQIEKYKESQSNTGSKSNSVDTEDSSSKLIEADIPAKENNLKNIKGPCSRNMICNFSQQGSSEKATPERNESSRESENVCKMKTGTIEAESSMQHEKQRHRADSESVFEKFEEPTSEILKVELLKKDNDSKPIKEPESRPMKFNLSLQKSSNSPERISSPESDNITKTFAPIAAKQVKPSDEALSFNKIIGSIADESLFCCLCRKSLNAKFEIHCRSYEHEIRLKRSKSTFGDRGKNVFCKVCRYEIGWKEIVHHGEMHEIPPWSELTKPSNEIFFRNHTACFRKGCCYCFLCETFLDYWDTTHSHFMEANHQKRKEKFGPTEFIKTNYELAVTDGIVPGRDMRNECKMCNITGLEVKDIKAHVNNAQHMERKSNFIAEEKLKHEERKNNTGFESNFVDTDESLCNLREPDILATENNPWYNKVPSSRNMICNFSLQGSLEEAVAEGNESSRKSEPEKRPDYADSESDSSEFEEPESRNMIFNFNVQENSTLTPERTDTPESRNVIKTSYRIGRKDFNLSDEVLRFNKITRSNMGQNLFCCLCSEAPIEELAKHIRNYGHKIRLERCKSAFVDRRENFFCKICSCEIEWQNLVHHATIHKLPPWSELTKPSSETFYRNHSVYFDEGYCYCYLCKTFLDYWDTARSHFMEADHQDRKEKFGPVLDLEGLNYDYEYGVINGILPGQNMTYDCKLCNKTGMNNRNIRYHQNPRIHKKLRHRTAVKILAYHTEKQKAAYSTSNRNINFNFSPQTIPKMTLKENEGPRESGKADETSHPSSNVAFAKAIVGSRDKTDLYCCICCQELIIREKHLESYKHKIFSKKFKSFFEDRGKRVFCKTCSSEIDWRAIKRHGRMHAIPPWTEQQPSAAIFFENHTAKFTPGYCYCFLCERFLDYWDTAASHFKEIEHCNRKIEFGPIVDLQKHKSAIVNGFTPGKNRMIDCKICNKTGTKADIRAHSESKDHIINHERFTTAIVKEHEERENVADSQSHSSNTAASTSNPLKPFPSKKDENLKTIQVPYSRNMICNFFPQEIPDEEIPKAKETSINDQKSNETEYTKLPVEGKSLESPEVLPESINENENRQINYIVSSTSELCKLAIIGTDIQRKRNIAKQNTDEPDPYCLICYSEIPGYAAVNDHLNGKRHEIARLKYGCDNILLIEGEHYWCSACDGPVSGFSNVYRHITSNSHLSAIVRMQDNNYGSQNNLDQVPNLHEAEENLSCLYIVKQNSKKSFCQICEETQCPLATKNINDHIASLRHKISLKRYGCDNIVPKDNGSYHCECCLCNLPNIESVYLHIKEKQHMSSLIKACNNEGQRSKRRLGIQKLPEHLNKSFEDLLSGYTSKQTDKSHPDEAHDTCEYSMISNFQVDPSHKDRTTLSGMSKSREQKWRGNPTASQNFEGSGIISHDDFTEVKRKVKKRENHGQKSALKYHARAKEFSCNVCGARAQNTTELHIHMASHYTEEFATSKLKRVRRADKNDHQGQQTPQSLLAKSEVVPDDKITNDVATNVFSISTSECFDWKIATNSPENHQTKHVTTSGVTIQSEEKPQNRKRSVKIAKMSKVIKHLDFDQDYIYELDDKLEDVKFGMMLALVVDSSKMYCLICRNLVEYTLDNYYEHLENIDHCEHLEEMEADHALFQDVKDSFSDLALAKEYMEETSQDKVRCVICDEDVKNNARSLQAHIDREIHERKCEETRAIAEKCFKRIKPKFYCDWYEVQKYWCVICRRNTESEVKFIEHFNKQSHFKRMKSSESREKRLIFDFCASCAILWYGYRCTHSYHNDIDLHKWMERDGHYVLTELPKFAKSLLASPEHFVDDKIKFLDGVYENEVEREKMLIRDLEKAAKMRFPRSKAYVFGSRISGLGSPDSDIDVFLDCRNQYDGNDLTNDEFLFFINGVHQCLCKDPQLWDVNELLTDCRIPIIKATHRATELSCDISFENGLSVENTKLIKAFNQAFPLCRKLTLFLKEWLLQCGLSGSRGITNYALYWFVIFFLQHNLILPSVQTLIAMRNRSHIIAGWEVGVSYNFTCNGDMRNLSIKKLLINFFVFYAEFNFRFNVACPLLGEVIQKRDFTDLRSLPQKMERYIAYMKGSGNPEPFRMDSPMCIQDPFDLQHNLTKAVNKVYLNRFRKCCAKSLEILGSP